VGNGLTRQGRAIPGVPNSLTSPQRELTAHRSFRSPCGRCTYVIGAHISQHVEVACRICDYRQHNLAQTGKSSLGVTLVLAILSCAIHIIVGLHRTLTDGLNGQDRYRQPADGNHPVHPAHTTLSNHPVLPNLTQPQGPHPTARPRPTQGTRLRRLPHAKVADCLMRDRGFSGKRHFRVNTNYGLSSGSVSTYAIIREARSSCNCTVSPPSTTSVCPVINEDSSPARKTTAWAMSSGWP
jgi:hypothetical protein